MQILQFIRTLKNPRFARLYLAQIINLMGDALTWLGLALLAFELAGEKAGIILSGALTLRVTAFVVFSPLAGVIADRFDRKLIMVITHLSRMMIVCLLPFVTQAWQIYVIVLALNVFYAFFTPTYTATIPLVTGQDEYPNAIALSSATYQLLGVLGPGLAGGAAALVGTRSVFFLNGMTFLIAAILLFTLPGNLMISGKLEWRQRQQEEGKISKEIQDIRAATACLFTDSSMRYVLMMQLVAAIAGAQILVNTVSYVQGTLGLGKVEYGWVMAAFGLGATLASIGLGNSIRHYRKPILVRTGVILLTLSLLPANFAGFGWLLILWMIAGVGKTLVNLPAQVLIADRVSVESQGRIYGAHFAWSHLWWAFSYLIAGWMGNHLPTQSFFYSSVISATLLIFVLLMLSREQETMSNNGLWHDHEHLHDEQHQHQHSTPLMPYHGHIHYHPEAQAE